MKPFTFDPEQLAALGLGPKEIEELAQFAQAEKDRETAALASVSGSCDQATAAKCAELGCYYGHRGPYWARWTAIQDARGLSLLERLAELSPRGVRWLASWAREAGDIATFAEAYAYFLHHGGRGDVTPLARDNSHYFAYLFERGEYSKIRDTVSEFFSGYEGGPGTVGYLYERVWLTFALVALGCSSAVSVAEKIVNQFPEEGGAWAALSVARIGEHDTAGARLAWSRATKCEYIEDDARRVALNYNQPNA